MLELDRRGFFKTSAVVALAGPIQLGGGSAASPLLWQDLADATGREVRVDPLVTDHSAIGAGIFAAITLTQTSPPPTPGTRTVSP